MQLPAHGANAAALYKSLNIEMPATVYDLSENVNSEGLPKAVMTQWPALLNHVTSYPHEQAEPFRSEVASKHGLPADAVVVTNGAAEGLMALAQYFNGQQIALFEPSFSEYRRTLTQQNCTIHSIVAEQIENYSYNKETLHETLEKVDAVYICNPNNPTGVLLEKSWIESLLQHYHSTTFVVDEAFIDWTDEQQSVVSLITKYPNLFVARSMTKMYAMAGVRLGYIIGQQAQKIAAYLPHWNVSGIAIALGQICINEEEFTENARRKSTKLRTEMTEDLQNIGCTVSKSAANFILVQMPARIEPMHFFKALLQKGIVLRHTKNYIGLEGKWFRIAVKDKEIWQRCKDEIENYVKNH